MITTRTWAIAGAAAALILVPAGVSYAVTSATDDTPTTPIERVQAWDQLRVDRPVNHGPAAGVMNRGAAPSQARAQSGDQARIQARDQVRDPAQDPSRSAARDQVREQLRDTTHCDGDGPIGVGPQAGGNAGRGGGMGGRS